MTEYCTTAELDNGRSGKVIFKTQQKENLCYYCRHYFVCSFTFQYSSDLKVTDCDLFYACNPRKFEALHHK